MSETFDRLIRVVRLREELKPLQILKGDPLRSIRPDWMGIIHCRWKDDRRSIPLETYLLSFRTDSGEQVASEQFETLRIALDQAHAIVGVSKDEWSKTSFDVSEEAIPWSDVEKRLLNDGS